MSNFDSIIRKSADRYQLSFCLLKALCIKESALDTWATRYESHWRWFLSPIKYAKLMRITTKTERIHQATSFGLCQVMGAVARECGFDKPLPMLCIPKHGLDIGAMKLTQLLHKHNDLRKALAAYNAGNPNSKVGQKYADHVLEIMNDLLKKESLKNSRLS